VVGDDASAAVEEPSVLPHHVLRMSEFIAGDGRRERVKSEK
jgi:hypothetical protein